MTTFRTTPKAGDVVRAATSPGISRGLVRAGLFAVFFLIVALAQTGCSSSDALCDSVGISCTSPPAATVDVIIDPTGSQRRHVLRKIQTDELARVLGSTRARGRVVVNMYAIGARKTDVQTIATDVLLDWSATSPKQQQEAAAATVALRRLADRTLRGYAPRNSDVWGAIAFAAEQHAQTLSTAPYRVVVLGDGVQVVPGAKWNRRVPDPARARHQILSLYPTLDVRGVSITIAAGRTIDRLLRGPVYATRLAEAHMAVCAAYGASCSVVTSVR